MEIIDRANKSYGIPATLKAHEPEWDIRASYESSFKDKEHVFRVKQAVIERTSIKKLEKGHSFRLCYFGPHEQWVNEANIRQQRVRSKAVA